MKKLISLLLGISLIATNIINANAKILDINPDEPALRTPTEEVAKFDKELNTLINDMAETMEKNDGVGIAAPQVGISLKVFLVKHNGKIQEYINPKIAFKEGKQTSIEGCLSVPGIVGIVQRPNHIKGNAFDKNRKNFEFDVTGDEACIICHENDHLYGKLFTDKGRAIKTFTNTQFTLLGIAGAVSIAAIVTAIGYGVYNLTR